MTTTALFIEIVIVGIQAAVWCVLLVLGFAGFDWIPDVRKELAGWELPRASAHFRQSGLTCALAV